MWYLQVSQAIHCSQTQCGQKVVIENQHLQRAQWPESSSRNGLQTGMEGEISFINFNMLHVNTSVAWMLVLCDCVYYCVIHTALLK